MHVIIWEFTVREEHIREFIRAYGSNGDWAKLFRLGEGYGGTQLLRLSQQPNVFLTIDRWESSTCFEIFREQFATQYNQLDTLLADYTLSERKVGVFEET